MLRSRLHTHIKVRGVRQRKGCISRRSFPSSDPQKKKKKIQKYQLPHPIKRLSVLQTLVAMDQQGVAQEGRAGYRRHTSNLPCLHIRIISRNIPQPHYPELAFQVNLTEIRHLTYSSLDKISDEKSRGCVLYPYLGLWATLDIYDPIPAAYLQFWVHEQRARSKSGTSNGVRMGLLLGRVSYIPTLIR